MAQEVVQKNTPQSQLRCASSPNLGEQLLMGFVTTVRKQHPKFRGAAFVRMDVFSTDRFRPNGLKENGMWVIIRDLL